MTDEEERAEAEAEGPGPGPSDFDELEWQKACEAENNFQKAVEMATSIFFPKSEEDWKFVNKWLFFYFPI